MSCVVLLEGLFCLPVKRSTSWVFLLLKDIFYIISLSINLSALGVLLYELFIVQVTTAQSYFMIAAPHNGNKKLQVFNRE